MDLDTKFLNSSLRFSKELYQKVVEEESGSGNVLIAPTSILSGLGCLLYGASGKTLNDMKKCMRYDGIPDKDIEKNFLLLNKRFRSGELSMVSKIYLTNNFTVKPTYKNIAIKKFQSDIESVDFKNSAEVTDNINQFVESKTFKKIRDVVKPGQLDADTKFVVVNTMHFKADWEDQFNPESSFKGPFFSNESDSEEVDYMTQTAQYYYAEFPALDATSIRIPYSNSVVSMLVILPNSKTGLAELESKLCTISIRKHLEEQVSKKVQLTIPKFKMEFRTDLQKPLIEMGMYAIYSETAEFKDLVDSEDYLNVSKVIHKAVIQVDEKGTEPGVAKAAAAGGVTGGAFKSQPIRFEANRPFLFTLIEDSKFLYIGRKVK